MIFQYVPVLGEIERDLRARRTSDAVAHMRRAGRRISSKIPFGYNLAPDAMTLVPDAVEQMALSHMAALRAEGLSFARIASQLTAEGICSKEGRTWYGGTVKGILDRQRRL